MDNSEILSFILFKQASHFTTLQIQSHDQAIYDICREQIQTKTADKDGTSAEEAILLCKQVVCMKCAMLGLGNYDEDINLTFLT